MLFSRYNTSVKIFKSGMLVKKEDRSSTTDGLHYVNEVVQWVSTSQLLFYLIFNRIDSFCSCCNFKNFFIAQELEILLNRFCNAYIRPSDATCCVPREHTTQLQYNSFAVFVAW